MAEEFCENRIILIVPTEGSRTQGNLRPKISLPRGINLHVLKYIENDTKAIVEVWSTSMRLDEIAKSPNVIKSFATVDELTEYLSPDEIEHIKKTARYIRKVKS